MKQPNIYFYRKIHRYFGLIIGIQFLFWTLGGLFFAWSNMDQIHGDTNKKPARLIVDFQDWMAPSVVISQISKTSPVDSILSLKTINFLDEPFYQIRFFSGGKSLISLANCKTGEIRNPLSKLEAEQLAKKVFKPESEIESTKYITHENVNKHHEYRGKPLPAYAIKFAHKSGTNVYVSTEYAEVMTFRNSNWRIFDFLWMMHTMDYQSRDKIGNTLLRVFSILGLITILSGFILYFKTFRWRKRFH